jgi:exopolysaccharide biosynthesis WecB/TagA/CpsF family protein
MSALADEPATLIEREGIQVSWLGGLPIAVIDREASAAMMLRVAKAHKSARAAPAFITSANGQIVSECARYPALRAQILSADLIHADGMPLVFASKLKGRVRLPERVATTDLFHDVARLAETTGAGFYLLGSDPQGIKAAVGNIRAAYPKLRLVGWRDGYFGVDQEQAVVDQINAAAPDILWVGRGVPLEIAFAVRQRSRLTGVGLIKTAGGLFDYISGKNARAPEWVQASGMEWLYRLGLEPRRLFLRYALTNPHAAYLLLAQSGRPSNV